MTLESPALQVSSLKGLQELHLLHDLLVPHDCFCLLGLLLTRCLELAFCPSTFSVCFTVHFLHSLAPHMKLEIAGVTVVIFKWSGIPFQILLPLAL